MRHFPRLTAILLCAALSGCTQFPQLDAMVSDEARSSDYPRLAPTQTLLARRDQGRLTDADGAALLRRAALLRARARVLRSIVEVNDETRLRLRGQLQRLGG